MMTLWAHWEKRIAEPISSHLGAMCARINNCPVRQCARQGCQWCKRRQTNKQKIKRAKATIISINTCCLWTTRHDTKENNCCWFGWSMPILDVRSIQCHDEQMLKMFESIMDYVSMHCVTMSSIIVQCVLLVFRQPAIFDSSRFAAPIVASSFRLTRLLSSQPPVTFSRDTHRFESATKLTPIELISH